VSATWPGSVIAHGALLNSIEAEMAEAEEKAWDSLGRYKFQMFGYWAAIWVHLNRLGGFRRPNPFTTIVAAARNRPRSHL
jgi:hypothetical protein